MSAGAPDPDQIDPAAARAMLEWQVEAGATDAVGEAPVDRYALPDERPHRRRAETGATARGATEATTPRAGPAAQAEPASQVPGRPAPKPRGGDAGGVVADAEAAAAGAADLPALKAAMEAYPHCELRRGARNIVFSDGHPAADLMIVGEAPGANEDRDGIPFVGVSGQLLDRMLAAIGRDRRAAAPEAGTYITNILPWRPPGNRKPTTAEIAMMRPFLRRHVELAAPKVLLVMGNSPMEALLDRTGITKERGRWDALGAVAVLPTFHPAFLLRQPHRKRESWADLQAARERLAA